jgi:hypothetical protein
MKRLLISISLLGALAILAAPLAAQATSYGGPNNNYADLCNTAYPTGCTQVTYNLATAYII